VQSPKRAEVVRRIEIIRNTWGHDIPEGVDWTAALDREYWMNVVEKFRPGDKVEIQSADHLIQFDMRIIAVNTVADPIYLQAVFLPVYPPDLPLPEMARQRPPRYTVRQAPGSSLWNVIDLESGQAVNDNPRDRSGVMELSATLERALLASDITRAVDQPIRSKAAARTARYRQRTKAAMQEAS